VLVGGGTTKIGDPSGKDESRKMMDEAMIQANVDGISAVFSKFLAFEGDGEKGGAPSEEGLGAANNGAVMVNNDDWLSPLMYLDFLREYGPSFTINRMMSYEVRFEVITSHLPPPPLSRRRNTRIFKKYTTCFFYFLSPKISLSFSFSLVPTSHFFPPKYTSII
jgi:hypothetical protein